MKEITIKVPDNCELKQDGNTYTIIEKEKKLTYEDIGRVLFKTGYFVIADDGSILGYGKDDCIEDDAIVFPNNCTSKKHAEKLLAINKLMNVAKYLNGNWQPNWNYIHEHKFYVALTNKGPITSDTHALQCGDVYFKSEELAKKAIEILGEETIKLALCTNY